MPAAPAREANAQPVVDIDSDERGVTPASEAAASISLLSGSEDEAEEQQGSSSKPQRKAVLVRTGVKDAHKVSHSLMRTVMSVKHPAGSLLEAMLAGYQHAAGMMA